MNKFLKLYRRCEKSDTFFLYALLRYAFYLSRGLKIIPHQCVSICGLNNIITQGLLQVGIRYVGFIHKSDRTYLNIKGKLLFDGDYSIARGCRFDIGKGSIAKFGADGYVNANTTFVISHGIEVGHTCAISWGCLFLDDDFHHLEYAGKKEKDEHIKIGNHVWIGCNVTILKGVHIPNGCVIAANSVVTKSFMDERLLIAGNPAVIIKSDVSWEM